MQENDINDINDIKSLLREAADRLEDYAHDFDACNATEFVGKLRAAAEQFTTADKVAEKYAGAMAGLAAVQTGETSREGRDCKHGHLARACEICDLEAKLAAAESQSAVPPWRDPYTNNGDCRYDTEYSHGWNACRDAILAAAKEQKL